MSTFSVLADGVLVGGVVLRAGVQRAQDVLQHVGANGHAGLYYELDEADLRLGHQRVVPVAQRAERQPQLALLVALQEELVQQAHGPAVVQVPSLKRMDHTFHHYCRFTPLILTKNKMKKIGLGRCSVDMIKHLYFNHVFNQSKFSKKKTII